MTQNPIRNAQRLLKMLTYVLGRRPDEFGLVPDENGFVKIKTLLQALHEEDGWRHVRPKMIDEIFLTLPDPPLEIRERMIRALDRDHLPQPTFADTPPKLLYTCVRQRAYPRVSRHGINPTGHTQIVLSSKRDMAERIGRRFDPDPVTLTVNTGQSADKGTVFFQSAGTLFTADFIPSGCFMGPPLPKEKPEAVKKTKPEPQTAPTPGSYFPDFGKAPPGGRRSKWDQKGGDPKGKSGRRKQRKPKRERPPWRS